MRIVAIVCFLLALCSAALGLICLGLMLTTRVEPFVLSLYWRTNSLHLFTLLVSLALVVLCVRLGMLALRRNGP